MVAPHDTGELVRSLVRVPGSGYDYEKVGSKSLDLGRASSLAALVSVPPLPAVLNNTPVSPPPPPMNNQKLQDKESAVRAGIIGSGGGGPSKIVVNNKVYKVIMMTPAELQKNAKRLVPIFTPQGNFLSLTAQSLPSENLPSRSKKPSLQELIHSVNMLKQENKILEKRLCLFQQLFKDKKRLKSVVKRLGVTC